MKPPVFVTGNKAKAHYFCKSVAFEVDHENINLNEIQSTDMKAITEDKAKRAFDVLHRPVIVEDVGLYFDAWEGMPGPFIKFFVDLDDGLEKLCRMLDSFSSRRANTVVITTFYDGKTFTHFEGGMGGEINEHPVGEKGFGYDPIWCIDGYEGRTLAELTPEEVENAYKTARPIAPLNDYFVGLYGKK